MTHYSHVSLRLLIKQNPNVLLCEFYTLHCQWTCLCGCKSATYSSKLPLWHIYICSLDHLWAAGQSRGWVPLLQHTCTRHPHSTKQWGRGPTNRLAPSEPHWGLALSALLSHRLGVGLASCTIIFFCSVILGSVLRHSDANYKEY